MYNRVILIGRLTRDPELRYTPSGHAVASFALAVDRPFKNQNGQQDTDFINIVTWRKVAEQVGTYLSKGRLVALEGRLQIRSYETQDGQKRRVAEVVADTVRFLDGRKQGAEPEEVAAVAHDAPAQEPERAGTAAGASDDEDVPF